MSLADAVALACSELSDTHLAAITATCRGCAGYDGAARSRLSAAVPGPHRGVLQLLLDAWSVAPATPGEAIAVAIESVNAAERLVDHPVIEVVCTGPDSPLAPMRLTSEVVLDLVDGAAERLTICSFSSYKVASVVDALDDAVERGVRVDLVLESQSKLGGGEGAEGFKGHRVFVWPDEMRPPNARLHAKAVVADSRDVLLTSANLSGAAFNRNLELGVLIRGGDVAASIQRHFDALIATGQLKRL